MIDASSGEREDKVIAMFSGTFWFESCYMYTLFDTHVS